MTAPVTPVPTILTIGAHNVYYVKFTRTFKRHVKAAGFVYVKKLLAHKFDPFPAVTLREFC
ncbi:hypothetical protein AKO33_03725 [Salmonella enterica subsp. enterica serovar Enteritidis]|nr:hypothetical protein [Salmonella enterica]ECW9956918.1 hypothetical protein [Salmonella enterica subsp. enterica serovar Enteritidis]